LTQIFLKTEGEKDEGGGVDVHVGPLENEDGHATSSRKEQSVAIDTREMSEAPDKDMSEMLRE
jgi:hypothetical protein